MAKNTILQDGKFTDWDYDEGTGELKIICTKCKKTDILTGDKAQKFNNGEVARVYTCLDCWKKNKEAEKEEIKESTQDRIARAQAMNCAVNIVGQANEVSLLPDKDLKKEILEWRDWFYQELTK